jgi:hypothetical protein
MLSRRVFAAALLGFVPYVRVVAAKPAVTMFKDKSCSCCDRWAQHMIDRDFEVIVKEVQTSELRDIKKQYGIPPDLQTCHTAVVEDFIIEGHVPAIDIQRVLKDRPKGAGLVVPGMPIGSPGMEGARPEKFSVLLFDLQGHTAVYKEYSAN